MKRINHIGHRGRAEMKKKDLVRPLLRSVLGGKCSLVLFLAALLTSATGAQAQPISTEKHSRYQIKLALDFDGRTYTGVERLRFVNHGEHSTSTLYFHLYPNVRVPGYAAPPAPAKAEPGRLTSDEPRLEITGVRSAGNGALLMYDLDDLETTLRIN